MTKKMKKLMVISAVIFGIGLILCLIAAISVDFDFSRLSTAVYEKKTKVINTEFDEIDIQDMSDSVELKPSDDGKCKIVYYDSNKIIHNIDISKGTLKIKAEYRNWTSYIFNINIGRDMTIYLPEKEYEKLYISTVGGNINMDEFAFEDTELHTVSGNISAYGSGEVKISTTSGAVDVTGKTDNGAEISSVSGDIRLNKFISESLTVGTTSGAVDVMGKTDNGAEISSVSGDIRLNEFTSESLTIGTASGDVYLDESDADKINISTVSGDVGGDLLGDKEIHTDTVSGYINVPKSVNGKPLCEIHTTSGNIILENK